MIIIFYVALIVSSTGFKRKYTEDDNCYYDPNTIRSNEDLLYNFCDLNNSDALIPKDLFSTEQFNTKLEEYGCTDNDIEYINYNIDLIVNQRSNNFVSEANKYLNQKPPEVPNNNERGSINYDEQPLTSEQIDILVVERLKDFDTASEEYLNEVFVNHEDSNYSNAISNISEVASSKKLNNKTVKTRFYKTVDDSSNSMKPSFLCEDYINTKKIPLKNDIKKYISDNFSTLFKNFYLNRVESIERAVNIFEQFHDFYTIYCYIFESSHFENVLKELIKCSEIFEENSSFNKEICDKFFVDFKHKITYDLSSVKLREKMTILSYDHRIFFLNVELMKIYKYAVDIPELLTLGGLFSYNTFPKVIFILHLINLFAESVGNLKENKLFVLSLVYKAFDCFYGNLFNIFMVPHYEILCKKDFKHDITFFIWELDRLKYNVCRRKKMSKGLPGDIKHLKVVLLIYLYQHFLFIQYYNVCPGGISLYNEFFEKVIQSENCIGCLFNEYLNNLFEINKD